jgi:hypothetical protein
MIIMDRVGFEPTTSAMLTIDRIKHRDRYTFYPKERITEEVIDGPISRYTTKS